MKWVCIGGNIKPLIYYYFMWESWINYYYFLNYEYFILFFIFEKFFSLLLKRGWSDNSLNKQKARSALHIQNCTYVWILIILNSAFSLEIKQNKFLHMWLIPKNSTRNSSYLVCGSVQICFPYSFALQICNIVTRVKTSKT